MGSNYCSIGALKKKRKKEREAYFLISIDKIDKISLKFEETLNNLRVCVDPSQGEGKKQ